MGGAIDLPKTAVHPFYSQLRKLLNEHGFDVFVEDRCAKFYAAKMGRPSLTPGLYFRSLLIGCFEGLDSERGIAWRLADSISLRCCLGIELDETTPDHSTISRTRRLIDVETHRQVFTWVLQLLAKQSFPTQTEFTIGTPVASLTTAEITRSRRFDRPGTVGVASHADATPAADGAEQHGSESSPRVRSAGTSRCRAWIFETIDSDTIISMFSTQTEFLVGTRVGMA